MERFSQQVRDEVAHNELTDCIKCVKAELAAILHISGSIRLSGGVGFALSVISESAGVARRVIKLLNASYNLDAEIRVEQVERFGKHHRYLLILHNQPRLADMIYELGMLTRENQIESTVKSELVKDACCRSSFLRGAFLAGGSISDPQKKTYHLEMVTYSEEFANGLVYLMNLVNIKAKLGKRKEKFLVYLKEGEAIVRFLSLISAYQGVIKLEEVRVIKGLRGDVNRIVNCETANLEKSLSSAWKQVELINELIRLNVYQNLPPNLRTTAELRLQYPEASLKELGEAHTPSISKSAVNHRLREITRYVEKFTEEAGN